MEPILRKGQPLCPTLCFLLFLFLKENITHERDYMTALVSNCWVMLPDKKQPLFTRIIMPQLTLCFLRDSQ